MVYVLPDIKGALEFRMTRKRKRELDHQEQLLWETVTRSVTPLVVRKPASVDLAPLVQPKGQSPIEAKLEGRRSKPVVADPRKTPAPLAPVLPPIVTMIRRERRAVVRGVSQIDAKLDLHGLRQDEAQRVLRAFLLRSAALGYRTVLVVTGKGAPPGDDSHYWRPGVNARGVLRRLAPILLESVELRDIILGYEAADQRHGGAGALYVRLRRKQG